MTTLDINITFFGSSLVTVNHFSGDFHECNSVLSADFCLSNKFVLMLKVQLKEIQIETFCLRYFFFFPPRRRMDSYEGKTDLTF